MIRSYRGITPRIGKNVFIAETACIIGDVEIKDNASIWYGAVIRGDLAPIRIGENTNVQDNCVIHTDKDKPARIADNVTIGHNAVVHGARIDEQCLIGIGSIILNDAHIQKGSVIAAGAIVKMGQVIGPFELAAGMPAAVKKALGEKDYLTFNRPVQNYLETAKAYMEK